MPKYSDKAEIMAIGDSLYQGVRSLTMTADLARNSPPAMIAKGLGKSMSLPLMERPILFDLESLLRKGALLHLVSEIRQTALTNVDEWLSDPDWAADEAFDNLSLGGAAIGDLTGDSFDKYWSKIPQLRDNLAAAGDIGKMAANIGALWYALNACFVLNPSRKTPSAQSKASPLQQVGARRPDTLLVNIGSNEGLFRAAFIGHYDNAAKESIGRIPELLETLAKAMKSELASKTKIIFNSLLRPRFIPNLMPRKDPINHPGDKYFPEYVARLGDGSATLTPEKMRAFDRQVAEVNADAKGRMEAILGGRLSVVDLYGNCDLFDGKHYSGRGIVVKNKFTFTNRPLTTGFFTGFSAGGFTGLDNMHPTVVGYTTLAQVVLKAMGSTAKLSVDEAYAADTLMNDLSFKPFAQFQIQMALLGSLGLFRSLSLGAETGGA